MEKIKVIHCKVGETPELIEIDNKLESYQKLVGGYIECVFYDKDLVMVCNEEGMYDCPPNREMPYVGLVHGNFFICKRDGENFGDLDEASLKEALKLL